MSAAARLRAQWPEIRKQLASIRRAWAPELVEYLQQRLDGAEAQGRSGPKQSRARSAAIHAGITKAAAALPIVSGVAGVVQRRIARKGPETFGLKRVPDLRTIRTALGIRKMDVSESERTHAARRAVYRAPSSTT